MCANVHSYFWYILMYILLWISAVSRLPMRPEATNGASRGKVFVLFAARGSRKMPHEIRNGLITPDIHTPDIHPRYIRR